jgi:hypothetical protein
LRILAQDAFCDAAIVVQVGWSDQYRASRHPRAAAIIASTLLRGRRRLGGFNRNTATNVIFVEVFAFPILNITPMSVGSLYLPDTAATHGKSLVSIMSGSENKTDEDLLNLSWYRVGRLGIVRCQWSIWKTYIENGPHNKREQRGDSVRRGAYNSI